MTKRSMTIEFYGLEDHKEVTGDKEKSSSGRVFVPKSWIGKRVAVFLLDPVDGE
jgi:hypothetical protein